MLMKAVSHPGHGNDMAVLYHRRLDLLQFLEEVAYNTALHILILKFYIQTQSPEIHNILILDE